MKATMKNKTDTYKKMQLTKKNMNESQISEMDKYDLEKIREAM